MDVLKKLIFVCLTGTISTAYASDFINSLSSQWRLIGAVSGGVAITSNLGENQNFPIANVFTDENYRYFSSSASQTRGMFEVFLAGEHPVLSNYLIQAGVAYSQTGSYPVDGNFSQGADASSLNNYAYHYNVLVRELLAQAKFMYRLNTKLYPYVLGGIGGGFTKASNYTTTAPPFVVMTRDYANNTSQSFAYRVGLGIDADITKHARLGIAYRNSGVGRVRLGSASIDNIPVSGTLSQSNLNLNELVLQLTCIV